MPSREINVRRFCANIVKPTRLMHVVNSVFPPFFSKENRFSFLSVNLPINILLFFPLENVVINLNC